MQTLPKPVKPVACAGLGDVPLLEKVFAATDNSSSCSAAPAGNGTAAAAPDAQIEGPVFYRFANLACPSHTHTESLSMAPRLCILPSWPMAHQPARL